MPGQRSFYSMWELIDRYVLERRSHFGREIIACIFWEETGFINKRNSAGAVGYGQVMAQFFDDINSQFRTSFTVSSVLASDEQSVEISILFLERWFGMKGSVDAALRGYGHYPPGRAYPRWKRAEADLLALAGQGYLPAGPIMLPPPVELVDGVARALNKCSQPGFDPYAVL